MSPNKVNSFFRKRKLITILVASLVVIASIGVGGFWLFNQNNQPNTAQAFSPTGDITMYKGEKKTFKIKYSNGGDVAAIDSARLQVTVGPKFTVDPTSFKDAYDTNGNGNIDDETLYCVNSSILTVVGSGASALRYRPRSATTTGSPCNGESTAGPTNIAPGPADQSVNYGILYFDATLKTTITDPVGTVLTPDPLDFQGIQTTLNVESDTKNASLSIRIVAAPVGSLTFGTPGAITGIKGTPLPSIVLTGNNVPTGTTANFTPAGCSVAITGTIQGSSWVPTTGSTIPACATTGAANGVLQSSSVPNPANAPTTFSIPGPTTIDLPNIGTGSCNPDPLTVGNPATCNFPLIGDSNNNYALPANPITAGISQNGNGVGDLNPVSGGYSTACTLQNNNTVNASLQCAGVPSTGGTLGPRNVLTRIGTATPADKGDINLVTASVTTLRSGKLYFTGSDNATATWDSETEFNTAYPQSQKYRDGSVKLIFDEIKKANGTTVNSGTCTFSLYRYTKPGIISNRLRNFNGTISNGKCVTDLTITDQTVNYYRVKVNVIDGTENLYNIDTLVLAVGGQGVLSTPVIG